MVSEKFEPTPEKCKFCEGTMVQHDPNCSFLAVQKEHQDWHGKSEEITPEFKEEVNGGIISFDSQMKDINRSFKTIDNEIEIKNLELVLAKLKVGNKITERHNILSEKLTECYNALSQQDDNSKLLEEYGEIRENYVGMGYYLDQTRDKYEDDKDVSLDFYKQMNLFYDIAEEKINAFRNKTEVKKKKSKIHKISEYIKSKFTSKTPKYQKTYEEQMKEIQDFFTQFDEQELLKTNTEPKEIFEAKKEESLRILERNKKIRAKLHECIPLLHDTNENDNKLSKEYDEVSDNFWGLEVYFMEASSRNLYDITVSIDFYKNFHLFFDIAEEKINNFLQSVEQVR